MSSGRSGMPAGSLLDAIAVNLTLISVPFWACLATYIWSGLDRVKSLHLSLSTPLLTKLIPRVIDSH